MLPVFFAASRIGFCCPVGKILRHPGRHFPTLFQPKAGTRLGSSLTCPQQELEGFGPGLLTSDPGVDGRLTAPSSGGLTYLTTVSLISKTVEHHPP